MAILAALFAAGSRFAGKILTTALGWASTLLFGRVPADRQVLVLGITFGSVIWMVLLAGILFPDIGTFLLVLIPDQQIVPEWVIRLVMLVAALIVPALIGAATLFLSAPGQRDAKRILESIVRGYPLTALLAVLLVFLAGLAIVRKARSLAKGWTDAHVPIVVSAGSYDEVADDLDKAITAAGLEVTPVPASAAMSKPAQWLAKVAGPGGSSLVPDRMIQLDGKDLDILIYPMDLLISGKPLLVNRARAAMASRLTSTHAHLTVSAEAQHVEDRLTALARPPADQPDLRRRYDDHARTELEAIDQVLATIEIPYEEWEVLYRQRLQVERDLRAGSMTGEAVLGAGAPPEEAHGAAATLTTIGQWLRKGAQAAVDAAADERTGQVIDRMAGPQWRWAARAASVAAVAAREALKAPDRALDEHAADGSPTSTGEPAAFPKADPAAEPDPPVRQSRGAS